MQETKERQKVDLSSLSDEELQKALKQREEKLRQERQRRKQEYEAERDALVTDLVTKAHKLHKEMAEFKKEAYQKLEEFREKAKKYGDVRSHSKGGFSLRNSETGQKVTLERNTKAEYDERADLAASLIKEFLGDMVKKRDKDAYEMISSLLEKNKAGDFNPSMIVKLIRMKDRFNDERWQKAVELFEECHNTTLISMNVAFFQKNNSNKDVAIPLTFASLDV